MSRSYWGIIAASGLACLLIVFGIGLYVGTLNYPDEERYQPYRDASNQPAKAEAITVIPETESLKYKEPCKNPEGRDESQLCAEWKAARAAERGALWAERGVWITLLGAIGLFVTILQGRKALGRARDANLIAKETADKQLRAYVYTDIGEFDLDGDGRMLINLQIKNFGQTPAKNVQGLIQSVIGKYPSRI